MIIISRFWALVAEKITYYALNHVDGCFKNNYPAIMKENVCRKVSILAKWMTCIILSLIWIITSR